LNIETGDPPAGWGVRRTISNKEFRTAEVFRRNRALFFTSIFCGSLFCGSAVHILDDVIADDGMLSTIREARSGGLEVPSGGSPKSGSSSPDSLLCVGTGMRIPLLLRKQTGGIIFLVMERADRKSDSISVDKMRSWNFSKVFIIIF
jgi:hypothetical protein